MVKFFKELALDITMNATAMINRMIHKARSLRLLFAVTFVVTPHVLADNLNVLVLGSTNSFSYAGVPRIQNPFNPQLVVDEFQSIMNDDPEFDSVNVVFEDVYRSATRSVKLDTQTAFSDQTAECYSLLNYYYWPNNRTTRLDNLKGAAGTVWNYVILLGDPSFIANTPGVYAQGVKLIVDKIGEGSAQPILMMQWPHDGSPVPVADFGEVTYRVGDSGGIPVAPAGYAWNDLTSKDSGTHPTAKGAYLAAATLYSKLFCRNAGTGSTYDFDDSLATLGYDAVQTHATQSHYTGAYNREDPYHILNEKGRVIRSEKGNGTSTEASFLDWGQYNNGRYFQALLRPQLSINDYGDDNDYSGLKHFHIGRAFGGNKKYRVWTGTYKYSMGFPFQIRDRDSAVVDGGLEMLYGLDTLLGKRGDQLVAFEMISKNEVASGIRNMPVYSIAAAVGDKESLTSPFVETNDGRHYGEEVNEAVSSYMMTLLTGRCPIGKNDSAIMRERRRIGYDTSWIMSTLNLRPPGLTVRPSAHHAKTVTPGGTELMSVYFVNPPQAPVTVDVSPSISSAAIVNPKSLTFDVTNYDAIQSVQVIGLPGASASENFDVDFASTSTDMCFNLLSDSWRYENNRASTESLSIVEQPDRLEVVAKNASKTISLLVAGSSQSNTILAHPFHGTLSWAGAELTYIPDMDYVGSDSFAFAINAEDTLTKGFIEIAIGANPLLPVIYATWAGAAFPNSLNEIGLEDNPDGDSMSNLMEFAFGTDPTVSDGYLLKPDGSSHGSPIMREGASVGCYELLFMRRKDHLTPGSVSYTVQFSSDLGTFTDSDAAPISVTDSNSNPGYEVVKVVYPVDARFGRIKINLVR